MNKVMLIGRIASDLELKKIEATGKSVLNLTIVTNNTYKDKDGKKQDEAEFHRCVAFGKLAEIIANNLKKGDKVFAEGKLTYKTWEKDGIKRTSSDIILQDIKFC